MGAAKQAPKTLKKMKVFEIPKKSGGVRKIYAPSRAEKAEYRKHLDTLNTYAVSEYAHAFTRDRNIITNAKQHLNFKVSICFDLSNFFDTVDESKLKRKVSRELIEKCLYEGAARQGLPTSPALANLAAGDLDKAIVKRLKKIGEHAVYTRYADDLTISTDKDDAETIAKIKIIVKECVGTCQFKLNERKTKVQYAAAGRREICGVTVDSEVHVPRKFKRRLRAAAHKLKIEKSRKQARVVRGMQEFTKLKEPKKRTEEQIAYSSRMKEAEKIATAYRLKKPRIVEKSIQDTVLDFENNIVITNDPVVFFGMSAFSENWTSCMSITCSMHAYKKGVTFWQRLKGASIACMLSKNDVCVAGVRRKGMIARCLVYQLRDGRQCFGKIYGHNTEKLAEALKKNGYLPCAQCAGGVVEGNVERINLPYFDNGKAERVQLSESKKKVYRVKIQ